MNCGLHAKYSELSNNCDLNSGFEIRGFRLSTLRKKMHQRSVQTYKLLYPRRVCIVSSIDDVVDGDAFDQGHMGNKGHGQDRRHTD